MSLRKTHKLASFVLSAGLFAGMTMASSSDVLARTKDNIFNNGFSAYSDSSATRIKKRKKYSLGRKYRRNKRRRKYSSRRYSRKYRTSYKKSRRARLRSGRRHSYNKGFSLRGRHMHLAHKGIHTGCFPARLRSLIARVHKRFGRKLVITSGYRSPAHNRRIGGAKRSQHMHCKAVDFRVPGVSTYALARYVKSLPGVGGVGTYCGQSSIHMDVGPKRSWHWGCGKRRHRRKTRTVRRYRLRRSYRG